ncbi:MAG: glycosyltransferase family 61 protein [Chitinispirillales bacterium]|jgi:hypothetical protein|nr:glycosyltransferase family 61 protein [Chitinispirillales bacterium]
MSLKPLVVEKGIIQPSFSRRRRFSLRRVNFIPAGVLTSKGVPVWQSRTVIMEREIVSPSRINPSKIKIKYVDDDVIYFCIPQNHFGHVLTGTMAFAYVLLNGDYINHKIVFIDKNPEEPILILLEYLGVNRKNVITVNQYTQFKSVVVVKPSIRNIWVRRFVHSWFKIDRELLDTFQAISKKVNAVSPVGDVINKVYFSRSKFVGRKIMYEDKIERVFKKNGYEIFYPELLPLDEQIKLVSNADFYACVQGTIEHHSLFMKDGATLIVMSRKSKPTKRQILINKLQKTIKHINIRTDIQPFGDKVTPNMIGATKDLIKFFSEYKFIYDVEDLILTDKEISDYVEPARFIRKKFIPKYFFKLFLKKILIKRQKYLIKKGKTNDIV